MEPFIASTTDIFDQIIGKMNREKLEELGYLEIQPLAYLRGKTLHNAIVVIEEAQNTSPAQMKTLLTRIGENTKFVISGDLDQSDKYNDATKSGLYDAMRRHRNISDIGFIEFTLDDVVRHPIISKILANYKTVLSTPVAEPTTKPVVSKPEVIIIKTEPINTTKSFYKKFFG
jgi:phosphate starvation-inducible PhoH-like protein